MRTTLRYGFTLLFSLALLGACSGAGTENSAGANSSQGAPAGAAMQQQEDVLVADAEVLETMDSGGYTYVRLKDGESELWVAGPTTTVKVGDRITVPSAMEMKDFTSKSLDRTFDSIWFAGSLLTAEGAEAAAKADLVAKAHGAAKMSGAETPAVAPGRIPKADGGFTVEELYARKDELAGKEVLVRGVVVKSLSGIMGKNWLHLQDGSGQDGTKDLTVTTDATANVGDLVLVRGSLTRDKDFGAGYSYDLIIENARVTKE